jgi:hypothetical protein
VIICETLLQAENCWWKECTAEGHGSNEESGGGASPQHSASDEGGMIDLMDVIQAAGCDENDGLALEGTDEEEDVYQTAQEWAHLS